MRNIGVSIPDFADVLHSTQQFESAALISTGDFNYTGSGIPEKLNGANVSYGGSTSSARGGSRADVSAGRGSAQREPRDGTLLRRLETAVRRGPQRGRAVPSSLTRRPIASSE
ncbi:MAG: hypothetical protein WDO73_24840 [Ignavibacteriota bacterium]